MHPDTYLDTRVHMLLSLYRRIVFTKNCTRKACIQTRGQRHTRVHTRTRPCRFPGKTKCCRQTTPYVTGKELLTCLDQRSSELAKKGVIILCSLRTGNTNALCLSTLSVAEQQTNKGAGRASYNELPWGGRAPQLLLGLHNTKKRHGQDQLPSREKKEGPAPKTSSLKETRKKRSTSCVFFTPDDRLADPCSVGHAPSSSSSSNTAAAAGGAAAGAQTNHPEQYSRQPGGASASGDRLGRDALSSNRQDTPSRDSTRGSFTTKARRKQKLQLGRDPGQKTTCVQHFAARLVGLNLYLRLSELLPSLGLHGSSREGSALSTLA